MMPKVAGLKLYELDLPFRHPFRHAARSRTHSRSLFMRCVTDDGHTGYGETLPRPYVTGETQQSAFDLLAQRILPRLVGRPFASFEQLQAFLADCDGKAPHDWVPPGTPQTAAWCVVDLALLDAFGRSFDRNLDAAYRAARDPTGAPWPRRLGFSAVVSSDMGWRTTATLLKVRLYGIRDVKVKVAGGSLRGVRLARRILGRAAHLRIDGNMGWTFDQARRSMARLAELGVEIVEQPLPSSDLDGMARLLATTQLALMADEAFHDADSLARLAALRACTAVNVRIAKCGGLTAALARCREALQEGLTLQIGCHVGETSQLAAAQLVLVRALGGNIAHLEGCYGKHLLALDPVSPILQFGRRGRPPALPVGAGLGTEVDESMVERFAGRRIAFGVLREVA